MALPFLVMACLGGGCGRGSGAAPLVAATIRDSAGVVLVHNVGHPTPNACAVVLLPPALTIPAGKGEAGAPSLYSVRGATRLRDGRVAVLSAGTEQLLLFTGDGAVSAAIGRRGEGPGEFIGPDWLGRTDVDTLLVWDTRLNRLSLFHDGAFLHSYSLPGRPAVRGRFSDGSLLVRPVTLVQVTGDGRVKRDSLSYQRFEVGRNTTTALVHGLSAEWVDAKTGPYDLPFGRGELFVAHGRFLVGGDTGVPAIRFYDLAGALRRVVSWESPSVRVSPEDRRRTLVYLAETARLGDQPGPIEIGGVRPHFSVIRTDSEGWLWIREFRAPWEDAASWLLFNSEGVLHCRVEMPGELVVFEIGRDYVLGRLEDDAGEESVVLFSLRRSSADPGAAR